MVTRTFALSVGTSVKELLGKNPKRTAVKVFNLAANTVYVLSGQVQAYTDGYPVTSAIPFEATDPRDELWIVASTGTNDVRVMVTSE